MAYKELNDAQLDVVFAEGFLEEWLKEAPAIVKEQLKTLIDGIALYRDKYLGAQEDYTILLNRYNQLTALSAGYLGMMDQQKKQIDSLLIDSQREFHQKEE